MDTTQYANLHVSKVNDINIIRKKLWENAYSNMMLMNEISRIISDGFKTNQVSEISDISYDMYDNTITITTNRVFSNVEVTSRFNVIFGKIVDAFYKKYYILTQEEYRTCCTRLSLLYNLILNTNSTLIIKL